MSNGQICILDQIYYCSGSPSLSDYLKSREKDCRKGHFPYNWLKNYNQLYDKCLPEYNFFEKSKTSLEEYNDIHKVWEKENMGNMFDYLRYYNNLDVKPLVQAIEKHREFYYNLGYDMHKDAVSLSGLAEKIMFNVSYKNVSQENIPFEEVVYSMIENKNGEERVIKKTGKVYDNKVYLINEENKECFYLLKKTMWEVLQSCSIDIMKKM